MIEFLMIVFTTFCAYAFGRNMIGWALAAAILGAWVLIPLFMLKSKPIKEITPETMDKLQGVIIKKQMKSVNTVDDLFKQLETPRS